MKKLITMNTLKTLLLALTIVLGTSAANAASTGNLKPNEAEVTFSVNIHCNSCKQRLKRNIPFERGVADVNVSLERNTVYIKYNTKRTNVERLKQAIVKLNFTAEVLPQKN